MESAFLPFSVSQSLDSRTRRVHRTVNNVSGVDVARGPIATRGNDAMILPSNSNHSAEPDLCFSSFHGIPKNQSLDCAKDTANWGLYVR